MCARIHDVASVVAVESARTNGRSASSETWRSTSCAPPTAARARPSRRAPDITLLERPAWPALLRPQLVGLVQQPCAFGFITGSRCRPAGLLERNRDKGEILDPSRDRHCLAQLRNGRLDLAGIQRRGGESGPGTRLALGISAAS